MNAGELMEKVALNRQIKAVYNIGLRHGMEKMAAELSPAELRELRARIARNKEVRDAGGTVPHAIQKTKETLQGGLSNAGEIARGAIEGGVDVNPLGTLGGVVGSRAGDIILNRKIEGGAHPDTKDYNILSAHNRSVREREEAEAADTEKNKAIGGLLSNLYGKGRSATGRVKEQLPRLGQAWEQAGQAADATIKGAEDMAGTARNTLDKLKTLRDDAAARIREAEANKTRTTRNQRIGGAAAGAGLGGFVGGALGGRNRLLWGGLGSIAGGVGGHEAVRFHQNNPEFLSRLAGLMRKGVSKGVSSARGLLNK